MRENWEDPEYRKILWHTASHVLAEAVTSIYPKAKPTIGPPIEEGFYYDFFIDHNFTPEDLEKIEKKMIEILREKKEIVGEEVTKKEALEKFKDNKFKQELINEFAKEGKKITIFKNFKSPTSQLTFLGCIFSLIRFIIKKASRLNLKAFFIVFMVCLCFVL